MIDMNWFASWISVTGVCAVIMTISFEGEWAGMDGIKKDLKQWA